MAKQNRYTIKTVIDALEGSHGIKSVAAAKLGCSSQTIDNYINKYPAVKEAYEAARNNLVDLAESQLLEKLKSGEWDAVKYVLSTLGKSRGYSTRTELTGAEGEPIEIKYSQVPARDLSDHAATKP